MLADMTSHGTPQLSRQLSLHSHGLPFLLQCFGARSNRSVFYSLDTVEMLAQLDQEITDLETEFIQNRDFLLVTELNVLVARCHAIQKRLDTEVQATGRTLENKIKADRKPLVERVEQLGSPTCYPCLARSLSVVTNTSNQKT